MVDPINYILPQGTQLDPLGSFMGGLKAGAGMQQNSFDQQQHAIQLAQMQRLNQSLQQQQQQNGGQVTPQGIAQVMGQNPMLAAGLKPAFDALTAAQQQQHWDQAVPIFSAMQAGNYQTASDLLNQQATSFDNANQPQQAAYARSLAQQALTNPDAVRQQMQTQLSTAFPDKFAQTFGQLNEQQRQNQLQPAAVAKAGADATTAQAQAAIAPTTAALKNEDIASQIQQRAAQSGLDRDKLTTDTQLRIAEMQQKYGNPPDESQKLINSNVTQSVADSELAGRYNDLANRMDAANMPSGQAATAEEAFKAYTGNQDNITQLRNEYNTLSKGSIAANLPPQVTRLTDSDIKVFGAGVPPSNANSATMTQFLRSLAKVKMVNSLAGDAKAQWLSQNGMRGLGPASKDMTFGNVGVAKGATFNQFMQKYVSNGMDNYTQQSAAQTLNSRNYMQFAQPQQQQQQAPQQQPQIQMPTQQPVNAGGQ
jgi:hypothetical protein